MSKTLFIVGFHGIGKSTLAPKIKKVLDLDSGCFIPNGNKTRMENFIETVNFINGKVPIVLLTGNKEFLTYLAAVNHLNVILVYPHNNSKEEYINRYIQRGSEENFVKYKKKMFHEHLKLFTDFSSKRPDVPYFVLNENEYLYDKWDEILKQNEIKKIRKESKNGNNT